jgi:hypothetical protein
MFPQGEVLYSSKESIMSCMTEVKTRAVCLRPGYREDQTDAEALAAEIARFEADACTPSGDTGWHAGFNG